MVNLNQVIASRLLEFKISRNDSQQMPLLTKAVKLHLNMLKSKETPSKIDLLNNTVEGLSLFGKPYQHMITTLYPGITFEEDLLRKKFPNIHIGDEKGSSSFDLNYAIAVAGVSLAMKSVPFINNINKTITVLEFGNKKVRDKNNIPYKQTNQPHPDYSITHEKNHPNSYRYYDFKTGKIDSNCGHIKIINDEEEYKKAVRILTNTQLRFYEKNYPKLYEELFLIMNEKQKSIIEQYELYKKVLVERLEYYPEINPSFLQKVDLPYKLQHLKSNSNIDQHLNTKSFETVDSTQKTLSEILIKSSHKAIINYLDLI